MTYEIELKSHCEAPDFYDECEAESLDEATDKFMKRLPDFDRKFIKSQIREV